VTYRFSDTDFPSGKGKPAWFHDRSTPPEKRRAWFDELNRRVPNGEGNQAHMDAPGKRHDPNGSHPSLADEIAAAEREHQEQTADGAGGQSQDEQIPPGGAAEGASAVGSDESRVEHGGDPDKAVFLRLSKLSRADYDRVRVVEASALGIRIATLDKETEALRPRIKGEANGSDLVLFEPEPWPYPVDGAELLDEIAATIRMHVVVTIEQARTVALWVVASHAFMAFRIFPRLLIKAPNSECGKSTLKEVVAALVNKALFTDNASTPFIFRVIEQSRPTLLIDEGDSFIRDDEERRGIVNSGHHKNGSVGRIVGEDLTPKTFSTYCPMVIAVIGSLPVTIENRSIMALAKP
jgi:hypothetical protein